MSTPSKGLHPGLALALEERVNTMMGKSLAANSKRTYDRAWKTFQTFHQATFGRPGNLPVTPNVMAMFVAYMDKSGHACMTERTYASALSHAHKIVDVEDPKTKFWVRKVMDAAGSQAKATPTRRTITMEILGMIIKAAQLAMRWYDAYLMRAIFSLAFHACARIGEMVSSNGQPQHAVQAQKVKLGES